MRIWAADIGFCAAAFALIAYAFGLRTMIHTKHPIALMYAVGLVLSAVVIGAGTALDWSNGAIGSALLASYVLVAVVRGLADEPLDPRRH